ncbi:phosphate acyltransferase PlsX [Clostridiales bacterium COT073_COT-073]|nr:phosphate acyltransferase PlsX [Clostridiales bacterium COT073_COT-073]
MNKIRIAIDAMGGDLGPQVVVEAAVAALEEKNNLFLTIFGEEVQIQAALNGKSYDQERLQIVATTEVVSNDESPTGAIRAKKDSSLVRALYFAKEGKADAFVSAGSTGGILTGGTLILGRIKGIKRPALATFFPTRKEPILILDIGANVDSKPEYLHQFAILGKAYYNGTFPKTNIRVGLINNGAEAHKGSALTKAAYELLAADKNLGFVGNIEPREIHSGNYDVAVCDGFTGNMILKYAEGLSSMIFSETKAAIMSNALSKLGGLFIKKSLKQMAGKFDYKKYGGAPLLGLETLVVKAHGSSDALAFKNAIYQCSRFLEADITGEIKRMLADAE